MPVPRPEPCADVVTARAVALMSVALGALEEASAAFDWSPEELEAASCLADHMKRSPTGPTLEDIAAGLVLIQRAAKAGAR